MNLRLISSSTLLNSIAFVLAIGLFSSDVWAQYEAPDVDAGDVSFSKDIWPILQARCVACHNADRTEGDLRFDSDRAAIENGGHTGRPILGSSAQGLSSQDSELIRRITSTEMGYRMPKTGPRLTDSEIAALTWWINIDAPWDETPAENNPSITGDHSPGNGAMTLADRVVWFESQMKSPGFSRLVYLALVFVVTMVAAFFVLRKSQSNSTWNSAWLSRLKTILILLLSFLCVATYIHYDSKHKDAIAEAESVKAQLLTYTGPPKFSRSLDAPYPMHPPRLGGVYYRGNDERDPQLFNGGFYRTAQLEVWLSDLSGKHLKWGDVPSGELFIDFVIKRAANTTGELFNDQVMSVVGLTDDVQVSAIGEDHMTIGDVLPLETIEPDQQWRCRYRIGDLTLLKKSSGKLFLVQNTSNPRAHYAIDFELALDGSGAITADSQLWMGSLYNLNGRVFVPYDDQKILLDRWFDFRPIPEITGPQTDDPALLGIPEHSPIQARSASE